MGLASPVDQYEILSEGSVKTVRVIEPATDTKMGDYIFEFTDDTSVKDRGKLGFTTPYKGASMCVTAVDTFSRVQEMGIPTAFKEQVADNALRVHGVRIINPDEVDIRSYEKKNRLFPVEVMTRDVVTETSSAAKRLKSGDLHYAALGLSREPTTFPVFLPKTYVDGSTKLRGSDEYIPWDQLKDLAGASTADMNTIQKYVLATTEIAQRRGAEVGFVIFDHKDEYAYDDKGELMLADVPLALDEITGALVGPFDDLDDFRGAPFELFRAGKNHNPDAHVNASKQLYRDHYDAAHPEWGAKVKEGLKAGLPKDQLPPVPQPPEALVSIVSEIYRAFANQWTGTTTFDVGSLEECCRRYRTWAQDHYDLST